MFLPRVPVLEFDQISAPRGEPNLEGRASQAAAFVGLFFIFCHRQTGEHKTLSLRTLRLTCQDLIVHM